MLPRNSKLVATAAVCFCVLGWVAGRAFQFSHIGCFVDHTGSVRELNGLTGVSKLGGFSVSGGFVADSGMTRELCGSICALGGFTYFGLQFSQECFCGKSYGSQGAASESDCGNPCLGNSSQICGGDGRNSVFALAYPDKNYFRRLELPSLTVTTTLTAFWTSFLEFDSQCLLGCAFSADCQAAVFTGQQLCYLLQFAYPPAGLNLTSGSYFMRG